MSSATATMTDIDSGKRKASAAGLSAHNRPVKRRASKACCCCRARKVRCDVVENGSPCTNCRLDQVECIVTASKRRKFVYKNQYMNDCSEDPILANVELLRYLQEVSRGSGKHSVRRLARRGLGGEPSSWTAGGDARIARGGSHFSLAELGRRGSRATYAASAMFVIIG